jgi:hypothetical protein
MWKESLILKPRQEVEELFAPETTEADFANATYNTVIDVERLIKELKKKLQDPEWAKGLDEEDLDRLQTWYQELQTMLGEKDI